MKRLHNIILLLRGSVICLFFLLWSLLIAITIILLFVFIQCVPNKSWRHSLLGWLNRFPTWWMDVNALIFLPSMYGKVTLTGTDTIDTNGWYVMICNHQSWADILLLGIVFRHRLPVLKFFMKKELLWTLPIISTACYVLDYPFMKRVRAADIKKNPNLKGKDIETTKKACAKFRSYPTTVINFVEGTRFTEIKRRKQRSSYQHLLKPRASGVAMVINEMQQKLTGIVNVTINYSDDHLSFWRWLCGDYKQVTLHYEIMHLAENLIDDYFQDRSYRKRFQSWLNDCWYHKDQLLSRLKGNV